MKPVSRQYLNTLAEVAVRGSLTMPGNRLPFELLEELCSDPIWGADAIQAARDGLLGGLRVLSRNGRSIVALRIEENSERARKRYGWTPKGARMKTLFEALQATAEQFEIDAAKKERPAAA